MSHYLQRLAMSVIKPGGTIHPILEPLYSTRRKPSDAPWIEENDSVANTPVRLDSESANPAVAPVIPPPMPMVETTQSLIKEPLLPLHHVRSVAPAIESEVPISRGSAALELDGRNSPLVSHWDKNQAEGTGQASRREESFDREPRIISPRLQPVALTTSAPQRQASPRRSPATDISGLEKTPGKVAKFRPGEPSVREPDEIQIHIGRIEVTAVHPAPAPAAAKTHRNVPSLDEYLKRRDRRSP